MEETKNILYHYLLNEYVDNKKKMIMIDNNISKDYQYEVVYKRLKMMILYDLKENFETTIRLHSINEYKITLEDIKKCIQNCFVLKDYEIEFIKNTEICRYNDFLWFRDIKISFYDGSKFYDPSVTIKFNIDIPSMIKILKYRNCIISIQRHFIKRLYVPPDGLFLKKEYLQSKNIINKFED